MEYSGKTVKLIAIDIEYLINSTMEKVVSFS